MIFPERISVSFFFCCGGCCGGISRMIWLRASSISTSILSNFSSSIAPTALPLLTVVAPLDPLEPLRRLEILIGFARPLLLALVLALP